MMRQLPKHILIYLLLPQLILGGGCPKPWDIGPTTDDDRPLCAILYEHSEHTEDSSCYGNQLQVSIGEQASSIAYGWNDVVSSLIVREGCTLVGYRDGNYAGHRKRFTGTHYYLGAEHDSEGYRKYNWNDEISSYVCQCDFNPVACVPTDRWHLVVSWDNKYDYDITCKYFESHGTTLGMSTTRGTNINANIRKMLGIHLSDIFSTHTSNINPTFSWSENKVLFGEDMVETEVDLLLKPGHHTGVYQFQGRCGDTVTNTEEFEIRKMDTQEVLMKISSGHPKYSSF